MSVHTTLTHPIRPVLPRSLDEVHPIHVDAPHEGAVAGDRAGEAIELTTVTGGDSHLDEAKKDLSRISDMASAVSSSR